MANREKAPNSKRRKRKHPSNPSSLHLGQTDSPAEVVHSEEESPRAEEFEAYRDEVPTASGDQDFLLKSGQEARQPTQANDRPLDITPTEIVDGPEAGVTSRSDEDVLAEYEEAVRESMRRD